MEQSACRELDFNVQQLAPQLSAANLKLLLLQAKAGRSRHKPAARAVGNIALHQSLTSGLWLQGDRSPAIRASAAVPGN